MEKKVNIFSFYTSVHLFFFLQKSVLDNKAAAKVDHVYVHVLQRRSSCSKQISECPFKGMKFFA